MFWLIGVCIGSLAAWNLILWERVIALEEAVGLLSGYVCSHVASGVGKNDIQ